MDILASVAIVIVAVLLIILFWKIFKTSLRLIFKFLLNTAIGFLALILINFLGSFIGISIGVNWLNAIIIGIFGVPGVVLLLLLHWLLMV